MLETLDTIIGVVFVFLLFSLVVSAAQEVLAAWFRSRARELEKCLNDMLTKLGGAHLQKEFWEHPFIDPLLLNGRTPSYIPTASIALALLHIADGNQPGTPPNVATVGGGAKALALQTVLVTLKEQSGAITSLATLQKQVEQWIQESLERVSSIYRRKTQWKLLGIALVFAAVMNIDAVVIWKRVHSDKLLRDSLVAQAQTVPGIQLASPASSADIDAAIKQYQERLRQFTDLPLPIGWNETTSQEYRERWLLHSLGILLSALAASLGAPFWFDLLQRFVNIRSAIKPKEEEEPQKK